MATWVNVSSFGAVGDGTTDDTTAIQSALDASLLVEFDGLTYKTTGALTLSAGQRVRGVGRHTVIKPSGSSSYNVFSVIGSRGSSASLAVDGVEYARSIQLATGSVAALGLTMGDYIFISDDDVRSQLTRIVTISGQALTLADPLYWPFTLAKNSYVAKESLVTGLRISDLTIDGSVNTGANTSGMYLAHCLDCLLENLDLVSLKGAGIFVDVGYATVARQIRLRTCGNASLADFHAVAQTGFRFEDVDSLQASGFGPVVIFSSGGLLRGVRVIAPTGRCFKLQRSAGCVLQGFQIHGAPTSLTGLGIVVGSRRNLLSGAEVVGTAGDGLWLDGDYNECTGVKVLGNGRDIDVSSGTGNVIMGEFGTSGLIDGGTDTRLVQTGAGWATVAFNAANFTATGGGTWTVQSADQLVFRYMVVGKTMRIALRLDTTSVSGTVTFLNVAIPGGFSSAFGLSAPCIIYDNNGAVPGHGEAVFLGNVIRLGKGDGPAFSASTNLTYMRMMLTFEIA